MIEIKQVGERISRLRQKKGMTQIALADKLGVTSQAISKWERGQSFPDVSRLDELAELLGVAVAYLLTGDT
ncbi:MAG: helix-turn-helix transcriptional regulator [Clostridia bacterium]|nr:helix-turn-helix transcriptional regulator [Clostridia bacterium]